MPKSFLMSKRKKMLEEMFKEEEGMADDSETSSNDSSDDSGVPDSHHHSEAYHSSPEHELHPVSSALRLSDTSAFVAMPRRPSALPQTTGTHPCPRSSPYHLPVSGPYRQFEGQMTSFSMYPPLNFPISIPPLPRVCAKGLASDSSSPWTNVDTSIPFTTYLKNLSKVLHSTSSSKQEGVESDGGKSESDLDKSPARPVHIPNVTVREHIPKCHERLVQSVSSLPSVLSTPSVLRHQLTSQPLTTSYGKLYTKHPLSLGGGISPGVGGLHPAFLQVGGGYHHRRQQSDKPPPIKKYKCDTCGKAFSRSNTLVTHKRIHTGDKPFKCEQCGRAFRQPGNLTRHRLTHTTFKPYVCSTCNKAFNRASNLHTHMRTHTNYKPFVCSFCGKGFHQKIDMKIHCYTHTGERPHKCDICGKGFTLASTLNNHRRTHVADDTHAHNNGAACHYCGACFLHESELTTHIMTSHQSQSRQVPV